MRRPIFAISIWTKSNKPGALRRILLSCLTYFASEPNDQRAPGRPVRNDARRTLEKFHVCLLLVLGIAFFGAGITAMGFSIDSPGTVGLGAGVVVAAGLIAVFFAFAGSSLTVEQESGPIDDASIAPLSPILILILRTGAPLGHPEHHRKSSIEIAFRMRVLRPTSPSCRSWSETDAGRRLPAP